jgi:hypothetical protein
MSKVLKVSQANYRLVTQSSGTITLDTGAGVGTVIITGNLTVNGGTTSVVSSNLDITSNLIQVNYGETGTGITLGTAGLQVNRGSLSNAQFLFAESISHYQTSTGTNVPGTFELKLASGQVEGLRLDAVVSDGIYDLAVDFQGTTKALSIVNVGGLVGVAGHTLTNSAVNYATSGLQPYHVPNVQYLYNYVAASSGIASVDRLFYPINGTSSTANSLIEAYSTSIQFSINQVLKASITASGFSVNDITISGDTITNTSANNLILSATSNIVEVNAILELDNQTSSPSAVSNTVKLFSSATIGPGKTGLYTTGFINNGVSSVSTTDELISKNRAVLLSILL